MMRRALLLLVVAAFAVSAGCGSSKSDAPSPTAQSTVPSPSGARSNIGPDGTLLLTPQPQAALEAALETISGFEVISVTFRGNNVTVKYDQVVNEPSELLLLRWLDFAAVASTFLNEPLGNIVLVPVVENAEIASVTLRGVDVVDYLDGKRPLEDVLASIVIE